VASTPQFVLPNLLREQEAGMDRWMDGWKKMKLIITVINSIPETHHYCVSDQKQNAFFIYFISQL